MNVDLGYGLSMEIKIKISHAHTEIKVENVSPENMDNNSTIAQGKQYLKDNWTEGVSCPCCGQYVKLYKRKITSSMAYALTLLYKSYHDTGKRQYHLEDFFKEQDCPSSIRGDVPKLRYWGMLKIMEESGWWELKKPGIQFVEGKITVPKYCKVFNTDVYGWSEDHVTIQDALTDKFSLVGLLGFVPKRLNKDQDYSQTSMFEDI